MNGIGGREREEKLLYSWQRQMRQYGRVPEHGLSVRMVSLGLGRGKEEAEWAVIPRRVQE